VLIVFAFAIIRVLIVLSEVGLNRNESDQAGWQPADRRRRCSISVAKVTPVYLAQHASDVA